MVDNLMRVTVQFEVENVVNLTDQGVLIFAKTMDDTEFFVKAGQQLNGCEISGGSIPRALEEDGRPRFDLWGFLLKNRNDEARFSVGDIVELSQ